METEVETPVKTNSKVEIDELADFLPNASDEDMTSNATDEEVSSSLMPSPSPDSSAMLSLRYTHGGADDSFLPSSTTLHHEHDNEREKENTSGEEEEEIEEFELIESDTSSVENVPMIISPSSSQNP